MANFDLDVAIDSAEAAVEYAQSVRRVHRRRTERASPQRKSDIQMALDRLRDAMDPLRSYIGRIPYQPHTEAFEEERQRVSDASAALQRERRKLWKMR